MKTNTLGQHNTARWQLRLAVVAIILVNPLAASKAQTNDDERFSLSIGLFVTDRDSKTRIDAQAGTPDGTEVDLESDFGLGTSDSAFRLDGYWRFNQKHRVDFSWFDLSRTGSKLIQTDIDWNGTLFPVDTAVDSKFDLAIYKAAYTWSFLRRDKGYVGLTAGLYIADMGLALVATSVAAREVGDVTAPLPVFGLRGEYNFSEKWSIQASGEIFVFEYGDFDGSLYDLYAGVDYQLFDRMAIGVGINSVRMNIGVTKPNVSGDLDWQYDGGKLFLKFDF